MEIKLQWKNILQIKFHLDGDLTMTLDGFLKRGKKITLHCLWHWENGRLVRLIQTSKPKRILRAGNQNKDDSEVKSCVWFCLVH